MIASNEPHLPVDAAVDNAIAAVLTEQYGFLPLNIRYGAARLAREYVQQWASSCGDPSVTGGCGRPKGHTSGHSPYRILDDPGAIPIETLAERIAQQNDHGR